MWVRKESTMYQQIDRRPIKMRSAKLSIVAARAIVHLGITPNQVSVISSVFALWGATLLCAAPHLPGTMPIVAFVAAAACIQLRLTCNLLDGLMAVECDRQSKVGELFNEFPDRLSDVVLLAAAGYAAQSGQVGVALGWLAAVLAVATAYVRAYGWRYLQKQDFSGPMAKPQRMFMLTVGSLLAAGQYGCALKSSIFLPVLAIVCLGSAITCAVRTTNIARAMESKSC